VYEDARVEILMNDGDGSLTLTEEIEACTICLETVVPDVRSVFASDLNGDRAPDLLWTPDAPPYPYTYALNNGDGTFGPNQDVPIETCGTGKATTADVDADGDQDVLVPNNRSGPSAFCESIDDMVRVALNNGDGTFQPDYGVVVYPLPEMVIGEDVTGDRKIDLVTTSGQVSVARGLGGGAFAPHVVWDARGSELTAVDLDGDDDLDVATSDLSTSSAYVLRNNGSGAFTQIANYPGEQTPGYANSFAIDIGDLDGDGVLDLVVANPTGQNVGVNFGTSPGAFETEQLRYGVHGCFTDLQLEDMDRDGKLDVVGPTCIGSSFVTPRGVTVMRNVGGAGQKPGAIAGRVKDRQSGNGIAGATVDCGAAGSATTNARGKYRIANVVAGTYSCTASAAGHRSQTKSVTVRSGKTKSASFVLRRT
jgi:hypothetical protein